MQMGQEEVKAIPHLCGVEVCFLAMGRGASLVAVLLQGLCSVAAKRLQCHCKALAAALQK